MLQELNLSNWDQEKTEQFPFDHAMNQAEPRSRDFDLEDDGEASDSHDFLGEEQRFDSFDWSSSTYV